MTLKDIAARAGVSVSTVSRVLSGGSPSCASEEVRARVWSAARETGYVPNAAARALKAGSGARARVVSCLVTRRRSVEEDPFFRELERRVGVELYAAGCRLGGVFDAQSVGERELRGSDGVVVLGRCPEYLPQMVREITRNIVGISRNPRDFELDEVVCDGKHAAELAMSRLLELGHRRIAYIGDCSDEDRYAGYCEALLSRHLPLDRELMLNTPQTRAGGLAAMTTLLEKNLCTAAFCANDITALGALGAFSAGRGGRRAAVVSIDDIEEAALSRPALTTVSIPAAEMARVAVLLLCDRMTAGRREPVRAELPCRLIIRESCGG